MVCRARRDPAIVVNEVVKQWYESVKQRTAEQFASKSLETARVESDELDAKIEQNRRDLRVLAGRLPAGARQNPANNITAQQVAQYGEQVAQLSLELAQVEQYRSIYNDPQGVAVTAEDRAFVEVDPQVAQLAQFVFLLEQQRVADARVFGHHHAEWRQLDTQLEAGREKLVNLRIERLRERREDIREAANTAYLNTQHALFLARENLAKAEAALQDQEQLLFNYMSLEEELKRNEEYRVELDTYVKSLGRIVRQQSAVQVNIAQPAIDPLERYSPSVYMLPLGIFVALLLAVTIALTVELMDTSVRTVRDISRHLEVTVLGAIPDVDDEEVRIEHVERAVADAPRSMIAEAFRGVRTNLQLNFPAERHKSVLITSPHPEDGKTTVACNLAIAIAHSGERVLLIDANFRRPGLHKVFPEVKKLGLSNVLNGEIGLESCVESANTGALYVLGAGPVPPNPAELLGGEGWQKLLAKVCASYDQVLVDTAPVLLASDPLTLSTSVGGVILVIRARRNARGTARRAHDVLTGIGAHVCGAVLNAAQVARGGYFRQQLRSFYDYQADVEMPPPAGSTSLPKPP